MSELNSKLTAIEDVFMILEKSGKLIYVKEEFCQIFKININNFNIDFCKSFSEYDDIDIYNIKINDTKNQNLFRVILTDSSPKTMPTDLLKYSREKKLSINIGMDQVNDLETVKNLLTYCLFDEILEKTKEQIQEHLKSKKLLNDFDKKNLDEKISDVMETIHKIRKNANLQDTEKLYKI